MRRRRKSTPSPERDGRCRRRRLSPRRSPRASASSSAWHDSREVRPSSPRATVVGARPAPRRWPLRSPASSPLPSPLLYRRVDALGVDEPAELRLCCPEPPGLAKPGHPLASLPHFTCCLTSSQPLLKLAYSWHFIPLCKHISLKEILLNYLTIDKYHEIISSVDKRSGPGGAGTPRGPTTRRPPDGSEEFSGRVPRRTSENDPPRSGSSLQP